MENLQEKIKEFFEVIKLEKIDIININYYFFQKYHKNKNGYDNAYGNLLHEVVNYKYNEEKVLRFIETLLIDGYNVNYQGKETGYTFIHLALYGYTSNNEDYSHSTEFIVKLINLAKQYNFNVNLKDNDGDTIIHTALASEVYSGKVIPLLEALGSDFDISAVDGNNNSIPDALNAYIEEAKDTDKNWYNRLISEKEEIINYIYSKSKDKKENTNTLKKSSGAKIKPNSKEETKQNKFVTFPPKNNHPTEEKQEKASLKKENTVEVQVNQQSKSKAQNTVDSKIDTAAKSEITSRPTEDTVKEKSENTHKPEASTTLAKRQKKTAKASKPKSNAELKTNISLDSTVTSNLTESKEAKKQNTKNEKASSQEVVKTEKKPNIQKNTNNKIEKANITAKLEEYLKNCPLEEITIDSIRKWFNLSNTANDKIQEKVGFNDNLEFLLFEIIKFGFKANEKVILKFIEALLTDSNLNINVQEKDTGYSVVHKTLQGCIIDNIAYSYSTDFIVKLINLVKEHNFNVNIRDNDGNSIMHTAIMSKCYAGKIIPILDALGEKFKSSCLNKNGDSVVKVLLDCLKETKFTNATLYNKLIVAEEEIKKRFNCKNIDGIELDIISNPKTRLKVIDMTDINIHDNTEEEFFKKNNQVFIDIIMNNILINLSNNDTKDDDIKLRQNMFAILEAIDFLFLNFSHEEIKKNEQKLSTIATKLKSYSEELTAKTPSIFSIKTYYAQKILLLGKTNETSYLQNLKFFLDKLGLTKEGYIIRNYINKHNTIFNEVYGYEFENSTEISTFKALINQALNFNAEEKKLVADRFYETIVDSGCYKLLYMDEYYDFFNHLESDNFNMEILKSIIKLIKDELEVLMSNCFKQEDLFLDNMIANINSFLILKSEFLTCQLKIKFLNLDIEIGEFLSSELADKIKNELKQAPNLYPDSFDNIEFSEEKLQKLRIIFEQLEMHDEEQIIKNYIVELIQIKNNILYYANYTGRYYQVLRFIRYMMFNKTLSSQERIYYSQIYLDITQNNPTLEENNHLKAMDNITLKMAKQ